MLETKAGEREDVGTIWQERRKEGRVKNKTRRTIDSLISQNEREIKDWRQIRKLENWIKTRFMNWWRNKKLEEMKEFLLHTDRFSEYDETLKNKIMMSTWLRKRMITVNTLAKDYDLDLNFI